MAPRRTTHRSSTGKKLYAVRGSSGRFRDIQTYERAHRQDIKRKSKSEGKKTAKKRATKARVTKKRATKKRATKKKRTTRKKKTGH